MLTTNISGYQASSAWPHYRGVSNSNAALSPYLGAQSCWSFVASSDISAGVAIGANGTIYFGTEDYFYAINAKGSVKWSIYNAASATAAIAANGNVYFPSYNELYGFNPQGSRVFYYQNISSYYASPAIGSNGNIYIGDTGGYFSSITSQGSVQWRAYTGGPIYSSPAITADGMIYFGGYNNFVWALTTSGSVLWTYFEPFISYSDNIVYSSPAIDSNGYIYIGLLSFNLCVLSPTGSHVGSFTGYSYASFGYNSPSIGPNGTVYIGNSDGYVYALSPSTGGNPTLKWSYYNGGYPVTSVAVASDGTLWFGSNVYLYNLYPSGSVRSIYSNEVQISSSNYLGISRNPPSITADGTVYIGTANYLSAIYVENPTMLPTHSPSSSPPSIFWTANKIYLFIGIVVPICFVLQLLVIIFFLWWKKLYCFDADRSYLKEPLTTSKVRGLSVRVDTLTDNPNTMKG
jgi:outer membrane protein assembly factor BamB